MSTRPDASPPAARSPVEVDTLADREARNPFYRYAMHLALPLVVSVAVHSVLFLFLGYKSFLIAAPKTFDVGDYEASLTESLADQMRNAFQWNQEELDTPAEPEETSLDSLTNPLDVPELNPRDLAAETPGSGDGLGIGDGALSLLGTGTGAGEAGTGGFGDGLGGGGARIGQAGIWDLNIRANRIVYVVDFSGSIIVAVDDLKRELKRSVGRLVPSQSFNVILFYSAAGDPAPKTESFKAKLEPATPEVRQEFFDWIGKKAPMGETKPLDALLRALSLNPEAVFFFSDGFFDESVVGEATRANNRARAHVYCLVFDELLLSETGDMPPRETEGSQRLKRIAEANGGKVKIVTGKDLAKR